MRNAKPVIAALIVLFAVTFAATASAYTAKLSEAYSQDIYLYGKEKLFLINDLGKPHTATNGDNVFDTTILWPGQMTDVELYADGDYTFFDKTDKNNTGVIHVRNNETPVTRLGLINQNVKAGESTTLIGSHYPLTQANISIVYPDGSSDVLTLQPTSDGKIETPIQTVRTSQNGLYRINDFTNNLEVLFSVYGGVTEDNPLVEAPITNSTSDNSTNNAPQSEIDNSGIPNIPVKVDKAFLIKYIKAQIDFWTQMLAQIEAN